MKTFRCDECGSTFIEGCDEDSKDELKRNFGEHHLPADCAKVCDECYKKIMEPA